MSIPRLCAVVLSLALATGAAGGARAQGQPPSPEALQAANELFSVLSKDMMQQLVTQVTAQVWPSVEQGLRSRYHDITDATLAELRGEFERIQAKNLAQVMATAPPIYAKYFTVQELRDLLAFYRTPTGAKALRVLPQVMGEFSAGLLPRMKEVQIQTMDAFNSVLRQRGYAN
ncbi:MAG TPA: DUF2059 domain-containing protein [Xanthobacteraceae bacterium]|jgi:hypothetical protein|nr:DUF2059 domain-containing protein [Xanthobacteraceae bacterium]